jgi:short-subunit dehydrogenase
MTKTAIVGATGPTGIHLVAELPKTAAAVCVTARDVGKLAQYFPRRQLKAVCRHSRRKRDSARKRRL